MNCETRHGSFQCERAAGHGGECETSERAPRARPVDMDAQRELAKAAKRIAELEAALRHIQSMPCDGPTIACDCCRYDRMVASNALVGR